MKLLSQDGSSAAKESYIRLQSEFFEQAANEMRKLVESSQMQLFEDVEKSQAMEQLLFYEQCLAECETLLLADSTALE